ncbi:metallophosphoesterase [Lentibacillus jeotgali]|uniref:metallophosphoesterase n=1 Tax=Lentibacillus jeotgali TaxID=558169 RepID=UPI0002628C2F|nr:metallophosphoesterase [Lentibacillus jeotgali]
MKKLLAVFTLLGFIFACCWKVHRDTHYFKMEKVTFRSPKLRADTNIRILQISDLHNHVFGRDNERLITAVRDTNPDLIVLTGDLIDKTTMTFEHVFPFIDQLTAIHQRVFFVPGNHEWENGRTAQFLNGLRERKITILNNRNIPIVKNNDTINLAGIDDYGTEHDNLEETFNNLNTDDYTVLLSHSPGIIQHEGPIPADLILSGHTHGGQIRFPLIGALIAPGQGYFPKYDKGTFRLGLTQHLYIDSGLGTTRLPVRFLNKSQLSLITITAEARE